MSRNDELVVRVCKCQVLAVGEAADHAHAVEDISPSKNRS